MASQGDKKPKEAIKLYALAITMLLIGSVMGYLIGSHPVGQLREDMAELRREITLLKTNITLTHYDIKILDATCKYLNKTISIVDDALWEVAYTLADEIDKLNARLEKLETQKPASNQSQIKKVSMTLSGGGYGSTRNPHQTQVRQEFDLIVGNFNITLTITSNHTIPGNRGTLIDIYKDGTSVRYAWTNNVGEVRYEYRDLGPGHYELVIYSTNTKWTATIDAS